MAPSRDWIDQLVASLEAARTETHHQRRYRLSNFATQVRESREALQAHRAEFACILKSKSATEMCACRR